MQPDEPGRDLSLAFAEAGGWLATLVLGVVTLILGLVVSFHPTASLNVIAVLLGLLLIISGIFHLVRVFGSNEPHRLWLGVSGLLLIAVGMVLIRHLNLTLALIGLIIGISWIAQGLAALGAGFAGAPQEGRAWWIFFGIISLIGGVLIAAVPVASIAALAVLIGIWFVVQGLFEIAGSLMLRHAAGKSRPAMVNPPPQPGAGTATL